MTCPSCKNLMCNVDSRYQCPACKGEFFLPEQTKEIDMAWFWSKMLYTAAIRNEAEARRQDYKHGFLRSSGRQWQDYESSLYIR